MSDTPILRGGPVRARDLRMAIAQEGFERGVVSTLERFMDEYAEHRQQLRQATEMLDQCIMLVGQFMTISTTMQHRIDAMKRERDVEHPTHDTQ